MLYIIYLFTNTFTYIQCILCKLLKISEFPLKIMEFAFLWCLTHIFCAPINFMTLWQHGNYYYVEILQRSRTPPSRSCWPSRQVKFSIHVMKPSHKDTCLLEVIRGSCLLISSTSARWRRVDPLPNTCNPLFSQTLSCPHATNLLNHSPHHSKHIYIYIHIILIEVKCIFNAHWNSAKS